MTDSYNQAAQWFARSRAPDCSPRERAGFAEWCSADDAHAQAYAEVERLYARSAELHNDPEIRFAARTARRQRNRTFLRTWRNTFAATTVLAATIAAVFVIWAVLKQRSPAPENRYTTAVGEQRSIILDDGSTILLDSSSTMRVCVEGGVRHAVIERGQVQFQTVHDPSRPFDVEVGLGRIHDIGTLFQVRVDQDEVRVTLLEGAVAISAQASAGSGAATRQETLSPGQQLSFDAHGGTLWEKRTADLKAARGWTQGDLIFENRQLGELVDEMNRYTHVQIKLADPSLRTIAISGVFHQGDQQSLLKVLERGWSLQSKPDAENDLLLYQASK